MSQRTPFVLTLMFALIVTGCASQSQGDASDTGTRVVEAELTARLTTTGICNVIADNGFHIVMPQSTVWIEDGSGEKYDRATAGEAEWSTDMGTVGTCTFRLTFPQGPTDLPIATFRLESNSGDVVWTFTRTELEAVNWEVRLDGDGF
jgi:hypothetical protein